jgi:NADH-quinone oxidoreductase subunit H
MTEYSGIRWSFFFFEEYAAMLLMSVLAAFFWFGGFESPLTGALRASGVEETSLLFSVVCFGTVMIKGFVGIFLMMWLRWTLPRVRIDQVMTMGYKYLTPLSLFCVLGAACWEALQHLIFS